MKELLSTQHFLKCSGWLCSVRGALSILWSMQFRSDLCLPLAGPRARIQPCTTAESLPSRGAAAPGDSTEAGTSRQACGWLWEGPWGSGEGGSARGSLPSSWCLPSQHDLLPGAAGCPRPQGQGRENAWSQPSIGSPTYHLRCFSSTSQSG